MTTTNDAIFCGIPFDLYFIFGRKDKLRLLAMLLASELYFCIRRHFNPFSASCSKLMLFEGFSAIQI